MTARELIKRILLWDPFEEESQINPGIYHYFRESEATYTRFHLRIDNDGGGMLLANATSAARLSPTGVIIAHGILEGQPETEIHKKLKNNFTGATAAKIQDDVEMTAAIIANLSAPGDNYPIINLEDADLSPYASELIAPLRADIPAIDFALCRAVIDRIWAAAIPHITIHLPVEPEESDLIYSVEHAEDLGLITGVRGLSSVLVKNDLIHRLAMAGLDYIVFPYSSGEPDVQNSLLEVDDSESTNELMSQSRGNEVPLVVEIPLVRRTVEVLQPTLEYLSSIGVYNAQFYAIAAPDDMSEKESGGALYSSAMPQVADIVEELANEMQVRFIWQPPMLRDPSLTLPEQIRRGPRCSDDFSVWIESSGDVIPARGPFDSAGNILNQEWLDIWDHPAFLRFRKRIERPTRCYDCPDLAICAADCPRNIKGWSQGYGAQQ